MQLKKPSKKTSKVAAEGTVPPSEEVVATPKPRSSRSSKKKSELNEMASVTHHHKTPSGVTEAFASKPVNDVPRRIVSHHQIAELAYSYWMERGFAHGNHEEDWLRAERALGIR